MLKFAGLSSALFASSSGHMPRTVPASGSEDGTVLLVGRHGQRVLRGQGRRRASWEDPALPTPHSIHELGQHRRRLHPFALPQPPMASQEQRYRQLDENSDPDDPTPAGNDTRVPMDALLTPLYPGYGTHFSYVWVGTPGQRQSVIIDTGSHYTAFPCTGCSQCGQHTDAYWDMKNSSTMSIPKCNGQPCVISQSYSEGSSWKAIKVVDRLWVGGLVDTDVAGGPDYSIDFLFGCQTSETGLFRTQLADGIMGMSMDRDTLPHQLKKQRATSTRMFALCFRVGGGIMTLGGVEQKIHSKPGVSYAKLLSKDGWFQVNLLDIALVDQASSKEDKEANAKDAKSLGFPASKYNGGKGTIVDSGTTDTYLPSQFNDKFTQLFKDISGVKFSSGNVALSSSELARMPNILFTFEGTDGKPFTILMPWTNYVDSVGGGKYAFRIYLTEGSGIVLGANFMTGMDVVFDQDGGRVGFAKSSCKYEEFEGPRTLSPTPAPSHKKRPSRAPSDETASVDEGDVVVNDCEPEEVPLSECSAECANPSGAYVATGNQTFTDKCGAPGNTFSNYCHVSCNGLRPVRGPDPACPDKPWTECNHACLQSRMVPAAFRQRGRALLRALDGDGAAGGSVSASACKMTQQTRVCYAGACPVDDGDYLVFVDLRVFVSPQHWSYVHAEAFYGALARMFNVREANIELLNDASSEYTLGVKLHFQMRIKAKDYPSVPALHAAAQAIPEAVWQPDFKGNLIAALTAVSKKIDRLDYSRYGYLNSRDIEVLNAMALPIGDVRDPVDIPLDPDGAVVIDHIKAIIGGTEKFELLLVGVAMACLFLVCCVCTMHYRLRQEHAALEKDKIMGGSLRRMWNRFMKQERLKNAQRYSKVELSEEGGGEAGGAAGAGGKAHIPFSADADADDELDDEDETDMN